MPELYEIQSAPSLQIDRHRISKLPILLLNIHSRCNCRCVMCDIWKSDNNATLKADSLERHRESLQSLGVEQVVLTGGEPLLNLEIEKISLFFRTLNIRPPCSAQGSFSSLKQPLLPPPLTTSSFQLTDHLRFMIKCAAPVGHSL